MGLRVRYTGSFRSRAGIVWRVEILQEAERGFDAVGDLTFEASDPLTIEWGVTSKEQPVCGSSATLRIESPGDRTYEDLYTVEPGFIRMDVYRAGDLFWSGCLDPEFYEEPYERVDKYPVSLTFSDFGILDRLRYNLDGFQTLHAILSDALERAGLNYTDIDQNCISSSIGGAKMTLKALQVRSDNFYDEDGEACTLREVLEGILQPLALRIVQRAGRIWVYDLNGLHELADSERIKWNGSTQTMSADKVANNVKITWNTYAQSGKMGETDAWTAPVDASKTNINNTEAATFEGSEYFSYHYSVDLLDWIDATDSGFTLWLSSIGTNVVIDDSRAKFFKVVPQLDGSDCEGVAVLWSSYKGYGEKSGWNSSYNITRETYGIPYSELSGGLATCGRKILSTPKVWIPPIENAKDYLIRVTLPLLMDCRFNPFEGAGNLLDGHNEKKYYETFEAQANFIYVPVCLKFQPGTGSTVYVWNNIYALIGDPGRNPIKTFEGTFGEWSVYNPADDDSPGGSHGVFAYWDKESDGTKSGVLGWKTNRTAKNAYTGKITSALKGVPDGQYVPYPDFGPGGYMWLEVRAGGWIISDGSAALPYDEPSDPNNLWNKVSHVWLKLPEFEILQNKLYDMDLPASDVEYSGILNACAKEDLDISTICGTSNPPVPFARGGYYDLDMKAVNAITRAGRTTQAEELLIGTLYSQYAQRRMTLTGEADIPSEGLKNYTEANQEGKKFILTGEVLFAISDTSEVTVTELRPDEYEKDEQ